MSEFKKIGNYPPSYSEFLAWKIDALNTIERLCYPYKTIPSGLLIIVLIWKLCIGFPQDADKQFGVFMAIFFLGTLVIYILSEQLLAAVGRKIRRTIQQYNREIARSDKKPFFLLLRSMRVDVHQLSQHQVLVGENLTPMTVDLYNFINFLAVALTPVGWLVVIGGEEDCLHRGRNTIVVLSSDYSWREFYGSLVKSCRAIIIIPETSAGLLEEMGLLIQNGYWTKSVIVMAPENKLHPSDSNRRRTRWEQISSELSQKGFNLPPYTDNGMLYIPRRDLSIRTSVTLEGFTESNLKKRTYPPDQLRVAIESLLHDSTEGVPTMEVIEKLIRREGYL